MALIIRSSSIHAAGCYTTTAVRRGQRVVEYAGRLYRKADADALYQDYPVTYLFGLGSGSVVIDGFSPAMFINHSCQGNCETIEEEGRVWITARRPIAAGEEITYDYCLWDGGDDPCLCHCGSPRCRGSMYSPQEIARRKAAARQAAARSQKPVKRLGKRKASITL